MQTNKNMNSVIAVLVLMSLIASTMLILSKHQFISLATTSFAAALVIFSIPCEEERRGGGGGGDAGNLGARVATPAQIPSVKPRPRVALTQPTQIQMLPTCNNVPTPPEPHQIKDHIRNHGMYGIHGNLSCKLAQRSAVADSGLLQPLNARNQMVKFLSAEQLHAKDPHLILRKTDK